MAFHTTHNQIIDEIKGGGIGVLPTDTLYGLVGSALLPRTVERIYALRKRDREKPMILLIADIEDIKRFQIVLSPEEKEVLQELWPDKVSVVLPCPDEKFAYLHRGTKTLAFRIPKDEAFRKLLRQTGPLVAPSANTQGARPAETIEEAKAYFGDQSDFYVDIGKVSSEPSTVIALRERQIRILRRGAVEIPLRA